MVESVGMKPRFSILTLLLVIAYIGVVLAAIQQPESEWATAATLSWIVVAGLLLTRIPGKEIKVTIQGPASLNLRKLQAEKRARQLLKSVVRSNRPICGEQQLLLARNCGLGLTFAVVPTRSGVLMGPNDSALAPELKAEGNAARRQLNGVRIATRVHWRLRYFGAGYIPELSV